jgi:group I intron endonuclease
MTELRRSSQRKFHFIYKTTCSVTGKWYIGMHSTDKLDDGYLGSGSRLWKSIKKYGKDAHTIEILEFLSDRKTLSDREEEILTEELRADPMCMNIRTGGTGNFPGRPTKEETRAKLSEASKNYVRTEEWYEKAVATRRANGGYSKSEEEREKISKALTGKTLPDEVKKKIGDSNRGQKRSEETRRKISEATMGKPKRNRPPITDEARENIRKARIGKKHSEEAKQNMRIAKLRKKNESH